MLLLARYARSAAIKIMKVFVLVIYLFIHLLFITLRKKKRGKKRELKRSAIAYLF